MNGKERDNLKRFEKRIGYTFKNPQLLLQALTHSSRANEVQTGCVGDNERMEFLGDAVLEVNSSDFIYRNHPEMSEGEMSRYRASIVCEPTLAACARDIDLDACILLGKGEEMTGGRQRDSIVSDAFEAVIGALYLDGGMEPAKKFIDSFVLNDLDNKTLFYDSKTRLQEVVQAVGKEVTYEEIGEEGPDNDKTFYMRASVPGMLTETGTGHTKKKAEQMAAYKALIVLKSRGMI
ncbi:MAG: ribonuclease III [Lachnospiraceae bacterium]|jgi:ribonuclease-3